MVGGSIARIAAGIIRREGTVLLVRQQGPDDSDAVWALPGGVVEMGESFADGLVREIREEAGLSVGEIGAAAYLMELTSQGDVISLGSGRSAHGVIALVFEVTAWRGELALSDPDGFVSEARFVPLRQAVEYLEALPFRAMREPIVAYFRGACAPGSFWSYHQSDTGEISPRHTPDERSTSSGR